MAKIVRRKKKEFRCGVCGRNEDEINPSKYALKDGANHKPLCTTCAAAMRLSVLENYKVVGYEIKPNI